MRQRLVTAALVALVSFAGLAMATPSAAQMGCPPTYQDPNITSCADARNACKDYCSADGCAMSFSCDGSTATCSCIAP